MGASAGTVASSAGIDLKFLSVSEDPLRSEHHQHHEGDTEEDERYDTGLHVGHHRVGNHVGLGRLIGGDRHEGEDRPEHHSADDRTERGGCPTKNEGGVGDEGGFSGEVVRTGEVLGQGQDDAAAGTHDATQDERLHL